MANKRYFWLKLKHDFFTQPKIKKLRKIAGGDTYTIIYLKMQLLSIKEDGKIFFEGIESTLAEELALELDEDVDNVQFTIMYLMNVGLLEEVNESEYLLPEAKNSIGTETASAERVRLHRKNAKLIPKSTTEALHCNTDVTKCNTRVTKCNTDIDIDIDIDKEIDIDIDKDIETVNGEIVDPLEIEFNELWGMYKRKVSKESAFKSYVKARKGGKGKTTSHASVDFETIKNGLINYNKEIEFKKTEPQFIKHFSTWLNGRCWEDEYETEESERQQQADLWNFTED